MKYPIGDFTACARRACRSLLLHWTPLGPGRLKSTKPFCPGRIYLSLYRIPSLCKLEKSWFPRKAWELGNRRLQDRLNSWNKTFSDHETVDTSHRRVAQAWLRTNHSVHSIWPRIWPDSWAWPTPRRLVQGLLSCLGQVAQSPVAIPTMQLPLKHRILTVPQNGNKIWTVKTMYKVQVSQLEFRER